ncbi:MAG TPA: ABC transporter ATP-binding protein, partial [Dongiaceae bacterium]|nr:ABC transporter ATP-binding protein [Dongiaceae bacterium]
MSIVAAQQLERHADTIGGAAQPLLQVRGLSISAHGADRSRPITVGTDLSVGKGETVGIVGESGSGKSLTARAIARLLPPDVSSTGEIRFDGVDLAAAPEAELKRIRGRRLSLLLQNPFTMLNPLMRCGGHIDEMLRDRPEFRARTSRAAEVRRRLLEVGISDEDVAYRMPFQLSGGMAQRVALAAALARDPELLIADEPSTALDVTTQAEVIKLLKRVQQQRGMSLILITHDLRLAFSTCDRIYVLYAGSVVEAGAAAEVERDPCHPYTLGLLLSEPPATRRVAKLVAIRGSVPSAEDVAGCCSFAPRCDWAGEACRAGKPPLSERAPGRLSACVRYAEIKSDMRALRSRALEQTAGLPAVATSQPFIRVAGLSKTFAT